MATDVEMISELKDSLLDYNEQIQVIQAKADAEKRALTEDEESTIDDLFAKFEETDQEIQRRERILDQTKKLSQSSGIKADKTDPTPQDKVAQNNSRVVNVSIREDKGKWGWKSFGEFAAGVVNAAKSGGNADPRLTMFNAPTTFSSEGTGADGGFAVPPDFRQAIMEMVMAEDSLLSRTDQYTSSSNKFTFPKDENAPWDTTNGIQAYWSGENDQITQSKMQLKEETVTLNKLTALVPVTEELLEDAPSLDTYLRRKVPAKMNWKINDSIINGTGAGTPKGILNADALVTVTAGSPLVLSTEIFNMYSRLYARCRPNSVWLINQDVEPSLQQMTVGTATRAVVPKHNIPGKL